MNLFVGPQRIVFLAIRSPFAMKCIASLCFASLMLCRVRLARCSPQGYTTQNANQQWDLVTTAGHIVQRGSRLCIDIDGYKTTDMSPLQVYACHPEDTAKRHKTRASHTTPRASRCTTGDAKDMRVDLSNTDKMARVQRCGLPRHGRGKPTMELQRNGGHVPVPGVQEPLGRNFVGFNPAAYASAYATAALR